MAKVGRKGKYEEWLTEEKLTLLEGWARDGLTEKLISQRIGITEWTINDWKKKFPQFANALKKGKEVADYEVESSLFKSACGYWIEEHEEKLDMNGVVHDTVKRKWVPPSNTAQIFWLKNRRPDKWRDKPENLELNNDLLARANEILKGVQSAIE